MQKMNYEDFLKHLKFELLQNIEDITPTDIVYTSDKLIFHSKNQFMRPLEFKLNQLYKQYLNNSSIEEIALSISEAFYRHKNSNGSEYKLNNLAPEINSNDIKHYIMPQLIQKPDNMEDLSSIPHRPFYEFEIIYNVIIPEENSEGTMFVIDNNYMRDILKIDENELYNLAIHSIYSNKYCISVLGDYFLTQLADDDNYEKTKKELSFLSNSGGFESKCIKGIYAIQNVIDFYNTSAILNNNLLKNISEKLKTNLYIIPVTAHILLICKYSEFTPEEIQMALKIFGIQEEEDYLSSDIFIFNKESGELNKIE